MKALSTAVRSVCQSIERWFFGPVSVHAILICRVGLGSILFLGYLSRWSIVEVLYGPSGLAGYDFIQRFPESSEAGWPMTFRLEYLELASTSGPIWAVYLILLVSSLLFAMGIRPKLSGTLAVAAHILFVARNPGATWGWGTMIQPFMFYTIFAASNKQWSVMDWWRRSRGKTAEPTQWTCPAWPQRLIQIHITCIFLVLWSRFNEQSWLDGQALPFVLTNRDWARFDFDFAPYFGLLEVASVAALALEGAAPIALWIKPIRRFWALALIGFFATLVVVSSVGWWDFMMMVVLTVFLPTEWLAKLKWPRAAD